MYHMKNILMVILFVGAAFTTIAQPGKYAGTKKGLIGTVYTDPREIQRLSGWTAIVGSVLTQLSDPPMICVNVLKKGTTYIVFFSIEDTVSKKFTIADVMEIKPVTKGWTIVTSLCKLNGADNSFLVAWAKESRKEYLTVLKKAWEFNTEKGWIDSVSTKGISCLNEAFDIP
jgi:hypothetical protein